MDQSQIADITELERLPEIAWTTEIAGAVTSRAAEQTGLAPGTPVIVGTIDAAAEAISVGEMQVHAVVMVQWSLEFDLDERGGLPAAVDDVVLGAGLPHVRRSGPLRHRPRRPVRVDDLKRPARDGHDEVIVLVPVRASRLAVSERPPGYAHSLVVLPGRNFALRHRRPPSIV